MNSKLKEMMARYFKIKASEVNSSKTLKSLGAQDWQVIEMAMEFEDKFGVQMDADRALSLKKVSDWEKLITK
jgi:acyl carrier protein